MDIFQSKSGILTEKPTFKTKNENYTFDSQEADGTCKCQEEDVIDQIQEEFGTGNFKEEIGTADSCTKEDEASLLYGTHETQELEGGEGDLIQNAISCKKNPGHTQFIPVNDFNLSHLPKGYQDNDIFEFIKAVADLTFRVDVKMTSTERPEFLPNTNQMYAFYNKRGSNTLRLGTGMVCNVTKWTEEYNMGACKCKRCGQSDTPSKVWGKVWIYTATHVVFDDLEARETSCRLFYNRHDSPLVTLDGWRVFEADIEEDRCVLECMTCDVDLLDQLERMWCHWHDLWNKLTRKYKSFSDKAKVAFIVSHPHGCPKQVSVGQWLNRYIVRDHGTKYTHTACTCPGSSGANIHSLGYNASYYVRHVHSGVTSEGTHFSGTAWDLSLD